jgi:hypothetical protein
MEGGGGPHHVRQRLLDADPDDRPPPLPSDENELLEGPSAPEEVAEPPPAPEASTAAPLPRGASDLELRKRQRAWLTERARFDDAQRASSPPAEASK